VVSLRTKVSLGRRHAPPVGVAVAVLVLVGVISAVAPTARNPGLHIALETAATVIAALAALLAYGRFARTLRRGDLLLTAALGVLAIANLGFAIVPAVVTGVPAALAWSGALARLLAAALATGAALAPPTELRRPGRAARRWFGGCALALACIVAPVVLGAADLPSPVSPDSPSGDPFSAHAAMTVAEAALVVLFAAAAIGFARRAGRDDDRLLAWLAIACVFAMFSRLHYLIYPSALTVWFGAGDILRLACFASVLTGGVAEIRRAQRAQTAAAVEDERRRIARDLHDGTAQELAFIVQAARNLADGKDAFGVLRHIVTAAEGALDNTRHAIANLAVPSDEPLAAALERTAHEVATREGVRADVEGAADVRVPPATREALCLLVREAITNAIRHGGAGSVRLTIDNAEELRLRIGDDGRGFDPEQVRDSAWSFGLAGMDRRVAELGGELQVSSRPGAGTELLVVLP
jgi:signal transduction histidine kinase